MHIYIYIFSRDAIQTLINNFMMGNAPARVSVQDQAQTP